MDHRKTPVLGSPDLQARLLALRELQEALKNNVLWAEEGSDDENTLVSIRVLINHLFRWFKLEPVMYENEVLDLLAKILSVNIFVDFWASFFTLFILAVALCRTRHKTGQPRANDIGHASNRCASDASSKRRECARDCPNS